MDAFPQRHGDAVDVAGLSPPTAQSGESGESGVERQGQGDSCRTPPAIPFGWKVIPGTADAASVTLRVNLERLSVYSALDAFVMNPELSGGWNPVSVDPFFFLITHSRRPSD